MDRIQITEGGFSNPPIRRGEACLAHIPACHAGRRVPRHLETGGWKTPSPLTRWHRGAFCGSLLLLARGNFDHDQDHDYDHDWGARGAH